MTVPPAVHAAAVRLADADAFIDDEFAANDLELVLGWVLAPPVESAHRCGHVQAAPPAGAPSMSTDGPFAAVDVWQRESEAAARAPEVGMGFHEMYSYWVFVVAVTEHVVQVVKGGGHPSHFPECGVVQNVPRAEFPRVVRYEYLADRRYQVDGWAARAEGITVEQLEDRHPKPRRTP